MLRTLFARLALIVTAFAAGPAAAEDLEVQAALLKMIQTGDVVRVEAHFDALQARAEAGEVDPEDERNAYGLFETTHPDVPPFIERWLAAYPDSAYAHTAAGKLYHDLAWTLRGTEPGWKTHPVAQRAFSELMGRTIHHADAALAEEPTLLVATDLMFGLVHRHGNPVRHDLVAQEIMRVRPNAESLLFALYSAAPGWGGNRRNAERLCDWHATKIAEWGAEAVTICKTWLAATYYADALTGEEIANLQRLDNPVLDNPRTRALVYMGLEDKPDWVEAARSRIVDGPFEPDRRKLVSDFNNYTTRAYGLPRLDSEIRDRRIAWAKAREALDPFDPFVVRSLMLQRDVRGAEAARLHARILRIRPFDEEVWFRQGRHMSLGEPEDYLHYRGPSKMGIWVGGNRADLIGQLMMTDLKHLTDLEEGLSIDIEAIPEEIRPQVAKWQAFANETDMDDAFTCPILRAARFVEPMCAERPNETICQDETNALAFGRLARLKADAEERKVCLHARVAPLDDLLYTAEEAMAEPGMTDLISEAGLGFGSATE